VAEKRRRCFDVRHSLLAFRLVQKVAFYYWPFAFSIWALGIQIRKKRPEKQYYNSTVKSLLKFYNH